MNVDIVALARQYGRYAYRKIAEALAMPCPCFGTSGGGGVDPSALHML